MWSRSPTRSCRTRLKPFSGEVLLALEDGRYVAGVGLKRQDPSGEEIAVGTYLHPPDNVASARVAEAPVSRTWAGGRWGWWAGSRRGRAAALSYIILFQ
jgi:hypothetical protein